MRIVFSLITAYVLFPCLSVEAAQLMVGAARTDITPPKRVSMAGSQALKISEGVDTPLTANVTALESRDGDRSLDGVIFVSIDVIGISIPLEKQIREKVAELDPSIDVKKLVLNATHTHTGPALYNGPPLPDSSEIMSYPEVIEFVADRVAKAAVEGWKNRRPGKMTWGLDFAAVGFDRRSVYEDGSAVMYGNMNDPKFRGLEGTEDHDLGTLFFCDERDKLISVIINVACPSQTVERFATINADFWHPVREKMAARFGEDVVVLGWCGAAGGSSPRIRYRAAAVNRMNRLRGLDDLQEIARKIDRAVGDAWEAARKEWVSDCILAHRVEEITVPKWLLTEKERDEAKEEMRKIKVRIDAGNPNKTDVIRHAWFGRSVKHYEDQQKGLDRDFRATMHAIRIGEVAVCTNPLELFTDYGVQIKARSPAVMTFVIQLTGAGNYAPTVKAVRAGGYSAIPQSCPVGAEGAQMMTEWTVNALKDLYPSP